MRSPFLALVRRDTRLALRLGGGGAIGVAFFVPFIWFALTRRLDRRLAGILALLFVLGGLSSMLFGWLYGSIFGIEHWIHPLWMSPMSDPVLMLTGPMR